MGAEEGGIQPLRGWGGVGVWWGLLGLNPSGVQSCGVLVVLFGLNPGGVLKQEKSFRTSSTANKD
jgi:hypothetical protein